MKKFVILLLVFFICSNAFAQNSIAFTSDTINRIDAAGKRQGYWIITGSMQKDRSYLKDAKVEEGRYKDSLKTGIWIAYYPHGVKKSEITWVNNRPNGHAVTYYENGLKKEEGIWVPRRWRGDYYLNYETGALWQHFFYDSLGYKQGMQFYYHPNGKMSKSRDFKDGKENGWTKEYDESGNLFRETFYVEGVMDAAKTKDYTPIKKPLNQYSEPKTVKQKPDPNNICTFRVGREPINGEGEGIIYKNGQITMKGTFHLYKLINGEKRIYDTNGLLIQIKLYKNGEYIGDAPIPDDANK